MENYTRTDLACELPGVREGGVKGAEFREEVTGGFRMERLFIRSSDAARELERGIGNYVTVDCGKILQLTEADGALLSHLIAGELRGMSERLTGRAPDAEFSVFVAGLGNAEMTADAVGPMTVRRLTATRHLREYEQSLYRSIGCSSLSALAPGVLGQTGIETLELLRGTVGFLRPDVLLVIDALAARSCDRLASTVQITDAGIEPGSGVGNHRAAVTRETVGVPVIVLGVPTVVDSSTLVYDALRKAGIEEIGEPLREVLENGRRFFVSPKDCDRITEEVSRLLADAIGLAFTGIL